VPRTFGAYSQLAFPHYPTRPLTLVPSANSPASPTGPPGISVRPLPRHRNSRSQALGSSSCDNCRIPLWRDAHHLLPHRERFLLIFILSKQGTSGEAESRHPQDVSRTLAATTAKYVPHSGPPECFLVQQSTAKIVLDGPCGLAAVDSGDYNTEGHWHPS